MEIGSKRIPPAKDAARSSAHFSLELLAYARSGGPRTARRTLRASGRQGLTLPGGRRRLIPIQVHLYQLLADEAQIPKLDGTVQLDGGQDRAVRRKTKATYRGWAWCRLQESK